MRDLHTAEYSITLSGTILALPTMPVCVHGVSRLLSRDAEAGWHASSAAVLLTGYAQEMAGKCVRSCVQTSMQLSVIWHLLQGHSGGAAGGCQLGAHARQDGALAICGHGPRRAGALHGPHAAGAHAPTMACSCTCMANPRIPSPVSIST